jgi:alpha-glucuronidase
MKRALGLCLGIVASLFLIASTARAEDGYRLWLRYPEQSGYAIAAQSDSPMMRAAVSELQRGLGGRVWRVRIATPGQDPAVARLRLDTADLGDEGYLVRTVRLPEEPTVVLGRRSRTASATKTPC